jgi:hypothetical protein
MIKMEQKALDEVLERHRKWLNNEENGECADLIYADLNYANMSDVDLDYSAWPLWCGSLKAHVDDRIAIQLLYHTLSVVQHSPYISDEVKRALLTDTVVDIANRFHRVDDCGRLTTYQTEGT